MITKLNKCIDKNTLQILDCDVLSKIGTRLSDGFLHMFSTVLMPLSCSVI